ncbi:MAG: chemotaxis protein [Gammaproteobacteria bacterium SHHR-1]|uniref:chemotaxis protein n=1 Tax=Magnetovirga frankeli TaxID=947516 RepID=UPI0012930FCE|nr:chemotaxis protein [gamma proteobacterium SS-5]
MLDYLIAMLVIPILMLSWLLVQNIARRFARAHPEFGPAREEGGGCGSTCGCAGKSSCKRG